MVIFPKAAYVTWDGQSYEGRGSSLTLKLPGRRVLPAGRDNQLRPRLKSSADSDAIQAQSLQVGALETQRPLGASVRSNLAVDVSPVLTRALL